MESMLNYGHQGAQGVLSATILKKEGNPMMNPAGMAHAAVKLYSAAIYDLGCRLVRQRNVRA
jgi:hypothetical protein